MLLQDLADLAGYTSHTRVDGRLRPDVVRLHRRIPALLVADAKATERPQDVNTRARLLGYVAVAGQWLRAGFAVDLAVCHGGDDPGGWQASIASLARVGGLAVARADCVDLDRSTAVTWMSVRRLAT